MKNRCDWSKSSEIMTKYHDEEWGVPLHNDRKLFEFLILEGFQAGLSWQIVLNNREAFRKAFDDFAPEKVAKYNDKNLDELMNNKSIIRNKMKIAATVNNAQIFLKVQQEFGSFDKYIWGFVNHHPVVNYFETMDEIPAKTSLSDKISNELKKRGFKFIGSTVVYAHLQATGMVNDHLASCFRHNEIADSIP